MLFGDRIDAAADDDDADDDDDDDDDDDGDDDDDDDDGDDGCMRTDGGRPPSDSIRGRGNPGQRSRNLMMLTMMIIITVIIPISMIMTITIILKWPCAVSTHQSVSPLPHHCHGLAPQLHQKHDDDDGDDGDEEGDDDDDGGDDDDDDHRCHLLHLNNTIFISLHINVLKE